MSQHNTPFPRPRLSTPRATPISYPYYKLAEWDNRLGCFRDGKIAFPTEDAAKGTAKTGKKFRISVVTRDGRSDGPEFIKE